jgi:hypothetical protein
LTVSYGLIGALVGLVFAAVEYVMFGALIRRAGDRGEGGNGPRWLDLVRKAQLVLFPLAGYLVGVWLGADVGVSQ